MRSSDRAFILGRGFCGVLNAVHVCTDIDFMRNSAAAGSPVKAVTVVLMFKLVFGADV